MNLVINKEKILAFFFCYILSWDILYLSITDLVKNVLDMDYRILTFLFAGVFLVLFIYSIGKILSIEYMALFTFLLVNWIVVLLDSKRYDLMWTNVMDFRNNPFYVFFIYALIGFAVGRNIKEYAVVYKYMDYFAMVTVMIGVLRYILSIRFEFQMNYMVFSYGMLLHNTYIIVRCIRNFSLSKMIVGVAGLITIFIGGCRGAILILVVVILIMAILKSDRNIKIVLSILAIGVLTIVLMENMNKLVLFIDRYLVHFGINSRTIYRIMNGSFADDTDRFRIWNDVIRNCGIFGKGMFSDRLFAGTYSHNLFIELICDYGWIVGIIMSVYIIFVVVKAFILSENNEKDFLMALASAGLFKLMLSSSYLNQEPALYAAIGFSLYIIEKNRNKQKKNGKEKYFTYIVESQSRL